MIEIFHVSDLHFGKGCIRNRKAVALLNGIKAKFTDTGNQYLLVTGDFTQSGSEKEYKLAQKALMPFKGRVFITPGNHDYGAVMGTDYEDHKAKYFDTTFAPFLDFMFSFYDKMKVFTREITSQSDSVIVIGLNSCAKRGIEDGAQGIIGENQLENLGEFLRDSNEQTPKLVFLHHIPHKDATLKSMMTLRDWKQLMKTVTGRVDALAFGHQGGSMEVLHGMQIIQKLKSKLKPTPPPRPMQVTKLAEEAYRGLMPVTRHQTAMRNILILDAEGSVANKSFYHIIIEKNTITATVEQI